MKCALRGTRRLLHQRRDKGGNTHNFPFDTLTKVYRDSMYATQERYLSNPMYPERGPQSPPLTAPDPAATRANVTNHVGNIGVMSPAATPLSEWLEELHHPESHGEDGSHHHHQHHQHHHHDEHQQHEQSSDDHPSSSSSSSSPAPRHTQIRRGEQHTAVRSAHNLQDKASGQSGQTSATPTAADDEALRARLRAHIFKGKKQQGGATAAAAALPRHSGVQIEILSMYRSMLREVRRMDDPDTRRNLMAYIRSEFDKHRDVPRKNILKIEWQMNYGKRKLEDLQAMGRHTKFTMMR